MKRLGNGSGGSARVVFPPVVHAGSPPFGLRVVLVEGSRDMGAPKKRIPAGFMMGPVSIRTSCHKDGSLTAAITGMPSAEKLSTEPWRHALDSPEG